MKPMLPGLMLCLLACTAGIAQAQNYPKLKPITLYVPWTAGGPTDLAVRGLAEAMSKTMGQRVLTENKPGASGAMGATLVAKMKPDGYTLTQLPLGVFRLPYMAKTDFDPLKHITWIINVAGYEFATNVRGDAPWKSWDELIAYAKANPGKISYGHPGVGTSPHLTMLDLANRLGINWVDIPFKGSADSLTALRGGELQVHVGSPPWQFVKNGEVRPLITWGPVRSPKAPDVPTLKERYGIVANSPWGLGGAAGMDPSVVKHIHDATRKAMDDPALHKALEATNMELFYMAGAEYQKWAREQFAEEKKTVERLGMKP
jgi:tripartite-type tricarboxylate transporter receptor subunit TctC